MPIWKAANHASASRGETTGSARRTTDGRTDDSDGDVHPTPRFVCPERLFESQVTTEGKPPYAPAATRKRPKYFTPDGAGETLDGGEVSGGRTQSAGQKRPGERLTVDDEAYETEQLVCEDKDEALLQAIGPAR
jgi:hypothetical protein